MHEDGASGSGGAVNGHVRPGYQACPHSAADGHLAHRKLCLPVADRAWVPGGRVRSPTGV